MERASHSGPRPLPPGRGLADRRHLVEAHDVAEVGVQSFDATPGGKLCNNIVRQIEAPQADISTERIWNRPSPVIRVTYRNAAKVYFRLVRHDWITQVLQTRHHTELFGDFPPATLVDAEPEREWSVDLPGKQGLPGPRRRLSGPERPEAGLLFPARQRQSGLGQELQVRVQGHLRKQAGPDRPDVDQRQPPERFRA